jgi:hypothetical protein
MANTLLTPSVIGREALMHLKNNTVASALAYRDNETDFTGAKVGDTITIRKPATLTANEYNGSTISVQNVTETGISLQLEKHFDVSVAVTSKQWTLSVEDFGNQVVAPAMIAIAEGIDQYLLGKYTQIYNYVGTAGDAPDSLADFAQVDKLMNELKAPVRGRFGILNPAAKADALSIDVFSRLDARGQVGLTALQEAQMGRVMGADWHMDQNVKTHTAGTASALTDWLTNGTGALGDDTLSIDSATAVSQTFVVGDLISIAGEGQHVVTAAATASTGAVAALAIDPPLRAAVADGVAVTVIASHAANIIAAPGSIALAAVPLAIPYSNNQAAYINYDGFGIRVVSGYSMDTKSDTLSFDILCGAKVIDPRICGRILG